MYILFIRTFYVARSILCNFKQSYIVLHSPPFNPLNTPCPQFKGKEVFVIGQRIEKQMADGCMRANLECLGQSCVQDEEANDVLFCKQFFC